MDELQSCLFPLKNLLQDDALTTFIVFLLNASSTPRYKTCVALPLPRKISPVLRKTQPFVESEKFL